MRQFVCLLKLLGQRICHLCLCLAYSALDFYRLCQFSKVNSWGHFWFSWWDCLDLSALVWLPVSGYHSEVQRSSPHLPLFLTLYCPLLKMGPSLSSFADYAENSYLQLIALMVMPWHSYYCLLKQQQLLSFLPSIYRFPSLWQVNF